MVDYWVAELNCPSYACLEAVTWHCITCPADAGSGGSGSVDLGAVMAFVGAAVAVVFVILGIARVCIRRKFTGGSSTSRAKVGSTVSSQSSAVAIPIVHPVLTADDAAALMARSKAAAKMSKAAELLKAWELSPLDLTMYQKVGKGGQATVYRGKWKGIDVAIKQAHMKFKDVGGRKAERELEGITQAIRREVRALARVRHPNVVRMFGACFEPTPMVVMAYASAGTLEDALDSNKFQAAAAYVRLLAGIARGMEAVHVHKIIHLDLKPEDVLIGPGNVPWITDFGLSTSANMTSLSQSSAGGRSPSRRQSSSRTRQSSRRRPTSTRSPSSRGASSRASSLTKRWSRRPRRCPLLWTRAYAPRSPQAATGATSRPALSQSSSRCAGAAQRRSGRPSREARASWRGLRVSVCYA